MSISEIISFFKAGFADWSEDKASRLAAALSYYSAVSLAPLLIILLGIAGLVFGQEAATGQVAAQIQGFLGEQSAQAIQDIIANANKPDTGILSTIIGTVILLLGASGVFGELQDGLNTVWEVKPKPGRGILGIIKHRFLSMAMVLGIGFLLLVSLVLSAALAALGTYLGGVLPVPALVLHLINFIVSFGVITLLFALMYKFVPDVEISWNDVWIGAAITALLFTIGKILIGLYLGRSTVGSTYGAAGSLIVILIWIYYSAQILFFGAELTQVYTNKYGSRMKPAKDAEPITSSDRSEEGLPRSKRLVRAGRISSEP
jgi:membrane protein